LHDEEFRRAIEAIKLRAPIEDVVRERVPGLKKSGNGWVACCPFHEERTPSFRVDPRRGTWHCFGACGTGGDQIGFLERIDNLPFMEVLEILSARTGIELPRKSARGGDGRDSAQEKRSQDALREVLERSATFFRSQIATVEGNRAAAYLRQRGLTDPTAEAFGIGYAPASGTALVSVLRAANVDLALAGAAGLVRTNDEGRTYDFFRGRLVIPIRDERGRIAGFGARRLSDDDESGPKYINTAETALFHKGRLIYALDRALAAIRRDGRIVLVEGYTDVMAAHQNGVENVVAVLGTATTEDHAALIRRTGARRATLVFDGDEAGAKAAGKALHGLLPLDLEIDVVALRGGVDPCDLLVRDGASAFQAEIELARGWFEHVTSALSGLTGAALSREVDRVLELVARVRTPVHRESLLKDLAKRLGMPIEVLRQQRGSALVPRDSATPVRAPAPPGARPADASPANANVDPLVRKAWGEIAGAVLADPSLVPLVRESTGRCPDLEVAAILAAILRLYGEEEAVIDEGSVLNVLAEHPARRLVQPLSEAARAAESPRVQWEGAQRALALIEKRRLEARALQEMREAERTAFASGGETAAAESRAAIEIARSYQQESLRLAGSQSPD
jgi:DNA primase